LKLNITFNDGTKSTHEVTPRMEYDFEEHFGVGFYKKFRNDEKQSDIFWLAWKALQESGVVVKADMREFVSTLKSVDVDNAEDEGKND
jgi:hypothetical protein